MVLTGTPEQQNGVHMNIMRIYLHFLRALIFTNQLPPNSCDSNALFFVAIGGVSEERGWILDVAREVNRHSSSGSGLLLEPLLTSLLCPLPTSLPHRFPRKIARWNRAFEYIITVHSLFRPKNLFLIAKNRNIFKLPSRGTCVLS